VEPLALNLDLPAGHEFIGFEALGSTSDYAKEVASDASYEVKAPFLWIWTKLQTQGRGRRGREWLSREGNLTLTVLMRPECEPAVGAQLSFVSALAIADLISAYVDPTKPQLKWPNDVLYDGAKISGILLESSAGPGTSLEWLSIGMGVNLAFHPEGTPYPATDLKTILGGGHVDPLAAATQLIEKFDGWHRIWKAKGFEPIRQAWMARAKGRGEPIIARLADRETEGMFEGLDRDGNLIIRLQSGAKQLISAGEVYFP
jgi:BirA family biotin operon repressor/biotin-[acetyl-CoA-carboxylase] ligase